MRYGACPLCGAVDQPDFRLHDCRRRKFRLVLGGWIQVTLSWILRWRCLRCGKRFTDCPPFRLAAEAVCSAASAGEGQGVPGNRSHLPQDCRARGDVHCVRRPHGKGQMAARGLIAHYGVAVVVVARRDAKYAPGRHGVDSGKGSQRYVASGTVGRAGREVSFPAASRHTSVGDAGAGRRPRVRAAVRQGNLPPIRNFPRMVVR